MKKLFIFLLICFSSYSQKKKNGFIQFNGIYENKVEPNKTKVFLRFYANGKVLRVACISTVTVLDAKKWLNLEMSEPDKIGNYKFNGDIIKFSILGDYSLEFKGSVVKDKILKVGTQDLITGRKSEFLEDFYFVKIDDLK